MKTTCQIPLVFPVPPAAGAATGSGWNLDRSVQRAWPSANTYDPMERGHHGEGVHVYVAGTGVRTTHTEFGGRAFPALEYLKSTSGWSNTNRGSTWSGECHGTNTNCATDRSGRGTAVASVIGGSTLGVAKRSIIHAVKVIEDPIQPSGQFPPLLGVAARRAVADGAMDRGYLACPCLAAGQFSLGETRCSPVATLPGPQTGAASTFMDLSMTVALDWIIDQGVRPTVVNVEFSHHGGVTQRATNRAGKLAYDTAVGYGIVVVVAAGQSAASSFTLAVMITSPYRLDTLGRDACTTSPASIPSVITVGSSDSKDKVSLGSDWGSCIDIWAPGSVVDIAFWHGDGDIRSTVITGDTGVAGAHVAGAAALILRDHSHTDGRRRNGRRLGHINDHALSPAHVKRWLLESATHGQLKKRQDIDINDHKNQNELLYVGNLWSKTSWGYNFHDHHGHHHHSDRHGGGHHYKSDGHDHHHSHDHAWNYGNHHGLLQKIQRHVNHMGSWYCQWAH